MQKKLKLSKLNITAIVLLWIYLSLWVIFEAIAWDKRITAYRVIAVLLVTGLFSVLFLAYSDKILGKIRFASLKLTPWKAGTLAGVITLVLFEAFFAWTYPGNTNPDTIWQFQQAIGEMPYDNWHPVLHTLLFYRLPLIVGKSHAFCVGNQIVWFSLSFGYLIYALAKVSMPRLVVVGSCMFVWLNPYMYTYFDCPLKDCAMTILGIVAVAFYIQIMMTKGDWLANQKRIALVSFVLVLCGYMRHNGILFTFPMLIVLIIWGTKDKKSKIGLLVWFVFFFILCRVLVLSIDGEKPAGRVLESSGMPATVWCNVMKKNPEAMPEDTKKVLYMIASQEEYEHFYITGKFNSIKTAGVGNISMINNLSYADVIRTMFLCFKVAPKESWEAFAKLTQLLWGFDHLTPPWSLEEWRIEGIFPNWMLNVFGAYGIQIMLMLMATALAIYKEKLGFIHMIPLFILDFGTMLLLSGWDHRLFLLNMPVWICTIGMILKEDRALGVGEKN